MAQESIRQETFTQHERDEHSHSGSLLGPLLCWAVVFADIGTSIYYVPGILYGTVHSLAGFFVFLTMSVFVLLTIKYAEVTHRFPQGGGVVTVAATALNRWFGALGGMFILVDYFLTAAISCLSGMLYFSVVIPAIGPSALYITIGMLVLLGVLNWIGISESAKVSLVGAIIAFVSDIAILVWVFSHISFAYFLSLFPRMFEHQTLTPVSLLMGFAGSFLAFSGLESISQLSPVMKTPRKRVAGIALFLVVLTVGITSPVLTMLSTLLLPQAAANDQLSTQLISLLGGYQGNIFLQTEVAISASALLVFASNTAIIGAYHVFMALARMDFLPSIILQRNKLRGTPHFSIALATGIPIIVLILVQGNINILGDMYAFGLLGAFTLTCLGLDVIRSRERRATRLHASDEKAKVNENGHLNGSISTHNLEIFPQIKQNLDSTGYAIASGSIAETAPQVKIHPLRMRLKNLWASLDFWLGILTTVLVMIAWATNLIAKPLATIFGGTVAILGMIIAILNYKHQMAKGNLPVTTTGIEGRIPGSTLAVLLPHSTHNDAVMRTAISNANGNPVVFLYLGEPKPGRRPIIFEVVDPYLEDSQAKSVFGKAESLAKKASVSRRYLYRQSQPGTVSRIWHTVHPHDTIVAAESTPQFEDINPDRIRFELLSDGKVAHMLKSW